MARHRHLMLRGQSPARAGRKSRIARTFDLLLNGIRAPADSVVTANGGLVERLAGTTDAFGFRKLDAFAAVPATGRRDGAIEGTGSFGPARQPTCSNAANGSWRSTWDGSRDEEVVCSNPATPGKSSLS